MSGCGWNVAAAARRESSRPQADLVEREDGFYLYYNIPGVSREEISLIVDAEGLHLAAGTSLGLPGRGKVHDLEFDEMIYEDHLILPGQVDGGGIQAGYSEGVLIIFMPRRGTRGGVARRRCIPVSRS